VTFYLQPRDESAEPQQQLQNAMAVLMGSAARSQPRCHRPAKIAVADEKSIRADYGLFNRIIDDLASKSLGVESSCSVTELKKLVKALGNALLQVDHHHDELCIPPVFRFAAKMRIDNKTKFRLCVETLRDAQAQLHHQLSQYIWLEGSSWCQYRSSMRSLVDCLDRYISKGEQQQVRSADNRQQQSATATTNPKHHGGLPIRRRNALGAEAFRKLEQRCHSAPMYTAVEILDTDIAHGDITQSGARSAKQTFLRGLCFVVDDLVLYKYKQGGQLPDVAYLWKIPCGTQDSHTEHQQKCLALVFECNQNINQYLSRTMVKQFQEKFNGLAAMKPCVVKEVLRLMNYNMDMRDSARQKLRERAAEFVVLNGCPGVFQDVLNAEKAYRKGKTAFGKLLETLRVVVEEELNPAAEERRHSTATYSTVGSDLVSLQDLYERAVERLKRSVLASGNPMPPLPVSGSEWVRVQMCSSDPFASASSNLKGTVNVIRKIQTRTLRKQHQDAMYVNKLVKIMREWAVHLTLDRAGKVDPKCTSQIAYLSLDDKTKVHVGEPGLHVSAGVRPRNKRRLVHTDAPPSELAAADHDVHKANLTPAGTRVLEFGGSVGEPVAERRMYMCIRDSVFQASKPMRHVAELLGIILHQYCDVDFSVVRLEDGHAKQESMFYSCSSDRDGFSDSFSDSESDSEPDPASVFTHIKTHMASIPPVLLLQTDGGGDRNPTFFSVQLSHIVAFVVLQLDRLVAIRNAPGHSYLNPVERAFGTVNVGLENIALGRAKLASPNLEDSVRSLSSMAKVRVAAGEDDSGVLQEQWVASMQVPIRAIEERVSRLNLGGSKIQCMTPATDEDIEGCHRVLRSIDPEYTSDMTEKKHGGMGMSASVRRKGGRWRWAVH
jgi:hypothetical protein